MSDTRVPVAWSVRQRQFRAQAAPVLMFVVAVMVSGWLWQVRGVGVESVGEVSTAHVDVTSPTTGLVIALPGKMSAEWSDLDHIDAGDVLARVEEKPGDAATTIEIKAPISGTLTNIRCKPGQTVVPGEVIARIAADRGRHIVGYIPEDSPLLAKTGMEVTLRPRLAAGPALTSKVEQVGAQVQKIPLHQRTSSTMAQWGVPVRIKMPGESTLRPGSLVDLHFEGARGE